MVRGISIEKIEKIKELNKKISKKKSNIKTRYDIEVDIPRIDYENLRGKALSKAIETAESFLNPNNQKYQYKKNSEGVVFTQSEITKTKLFIARTNRIKDVAFGEIMNKDYTIEGRVIGKAGDVYISKLRNMDERFQLRFDPEMFTSRRQFEVWLEKKKKTYAANFIERNRGLYRNNYIEELKDKFGDASDVAPLIKYLEGISVNEFYRRSLTSDERHIDYIYDALKRDGVLQEIAESWGVDLGLSSH